MRRMVVFGADGLLGQELVNLALQRGHHVTAFSRAAREELPEHENLMRVDADVTDRAAVTDALLEKDVVFFTVGSRQRSGEVSIYSEGIRNVIAAMRECGVERLVAVSAAGVGAMKTSAVPMLFRWVVIPALARPEYEDMERMEAEIEKSDLAWTVFKPLWLVDQVHGSRVHVSPMPRTPRHWSISRSDVALAMMDAADDNAWLREKVWVDRS